MLKVSIVLFPGGMYMQQPGQPGAGGGGLQNGVMPNNMMGGMVPNTNMMQQPNMQVTLSGSTSNVVTQPLLCA